MIRLTRVKPLSDSFIQQEGFQTFISYSFPTRKCQIVPVNLMKNPRKQRKKGLPWYKRSVVAAQRQSMRSCAVDAVSDKQLSVNQCVIHSIRLEMLHNPVDWDSCDWNFLCEQ